MALGNERENNILQDKGAPMLSTRARVFEFCATPYHIYGYKLPPFLLTLIVNQLQKMTQY
jgi:hypothetical protein